MSDIPAPLADILIGYQELETADVEWFMSGWASFNDEQRRRLVMNFRKQIWNCAAQDAWVAAVKAAADKVAALPDQILCVWDRPGGPPGNGYTEIKGQEVIAAALRNELGMGRAAIAKATGSGEAKARDQ